MHNNHRASMVRQCPGMIDGHGQRLAHFWDPYRSGADLGPIHDVAANDGPGRSGFNDWSALTILRRRRSSTGVGRARQEVFALSGRAISDKNDRSKGSSPCQQ